MNLNLLWPLLCVLVVVGYVSSAEFGQFDNGFDPDDADTAKWTATTNCEHTLDPGTGNPTGEVVFRIDAYENDAAFYAFESCVMVDYTDLIGGTVTVITDAGCTQPARQSGDNTAAEYRHFSFSETITGATTTQSPGAADTNSVCGGYKDGVILYLGMYCYRDAGTLKQGDAVFLAQCNADTQYALMTMLTYGELTIGPPAMENIIRYNKLTFDVLDGSKVPNYDTSATGVDVDTPKTTFNHGDPVRLRICLEIDSAAGDTRTEFGDLDGWMDLGFYVLFNSISVISGRWKDDDERLSAMKRRLGDLIRKQTKTVMQRKLLKIAKKSDQAHDKIAKAADGTDPMGIVVGQCIAKRHADHVDDDTDGDRIADAGVPISTSAGCGLAAPPAQQAGTEDWFMFWVKASTDAANSFRKSPNCWYSESFEAVSFLGKNIDAPSGLKTTITCTIQHYCTASTETACFGDQSGTIKTDGSGYPTCPTGYTARRRRRNTISFGEVELPDAVNTTITVRMSSSEQESVSSETCFTKKSTFFAVTGVLGFLLLFSLAVVGILFCKLMRRGQRNGSENSKTAFHSSLAYGSHSAKSGIQNKGFTGDRKAYYR